MRDDTWKLVKVLGPEVFVDKKNPHTVLVLEWDESGGEANNFLGAAVVAHLDNLSVKEAS